MIDRNLGRHLRLAEKIAAYVGASIFVVLALALIASICAVLVVDGYLFNEFCLDAACMTAALAGFGVPLKIIEVLGAYLVGLATVMGLIVALRVYVTNSIMLRVQARSSRVQAAALKEQVKSSALQLHSIRFSSFRDYIFGEVAKFERLGIDCIDATTWYFKIHPRSIEGDLSVDGAYSKSMSKISALVESADSLVSQGKGKFVYKEHQNSMIDVLYGIGIRIESLPRLDYFMVEDEVFVLIESVHRVCGLPTEQFGKRNYRRMY